MFGLPRSKSSNDLSRPASASTAGQPSPQAEAQPEAVQGRTGRFSSVFSSARKRTAQQTAAAVARAQVEVRPPTRINDCRATPETTIPVLMDRAVVLDCASMGKQFLYTTGAGPCVIVAAVARGENGRPAKVTLAHVSTTATEDSVSALFVRLQASSVPGRPLEVTMLGGIPEIAQVVQDAVRQTGAQVAFSDAGNFVMGQSMSSLYAAGINNEGEVYFGRRDDLEAVVHQAMRQQPARPGQTLTVAEYSEHS